MGSDCKGKMKEKSKISTTNYWEIIYTDHLKLFLESFLLVVQHEENLVER